MISIRTLAPLSVGFALAVPAFAQTADVATTRSNVRVIDYTDTGSTSSGTEAPFLYVNGPYITGIGDGVGGANTSLLEAGFNTFGYGCQAGTIGNRIADDFTVPAGQNWTLSKLHWLTYQTGAPTGGSITGINVNIWNTTPSIAGSPLWSGPANSFISKSWTNVYRVVSVPGDAARAIIDVQTDLTGSPVLGPGTYWVDVSLTGSASFSGPWAPPTVPHVAADNGMQFTTATGWLPTLDTIAGVPQDFPYSLEGDDGTGGGCTGVSIYCTGKVNSLGCTPAIASTGTPSASAGSGFNITCSQVINNKNGLYFYSHTGQQAVPFQGGFLCIKSPQKRTAVQNSAGNAPPNDCSGTYSIDFNAYIASGVDPLNVAGAVIDGQYWARDPVSASTTSLSNGISFQICP